MNDLFAVKHAILIPLLPLLGAVVSGFFGARWLKEKSHWPIWIGVGISALLSIWLLVGTIGQMATPEQLQSSAYDWKVLPYAVTNYWTWIRAGDFSVKWGYFFDPLTVMMLCVVCCIGWLITVYAAGYMKGEAGYFRFFAYLGLFIFSMTTLVMGENLIMLYLGWEGVGLCSYLLIGYYYDKPSAVEAAKKAFLVNRIGDYGFSLGIMLCFLAFGTVSYYGGGLGSSNPGLLELAAQNSPPHPGHWALQYIPFLLMLGAFGKSAQFPLHVWLPDAMEGPTPVSALIHAATMVTAGVYMIARCGTLFAANQAALITIAFIGAFTALMAASIALRQFDLKRVFAYSTVSQLGYMFVGVGTLAPVAGLFHLITHAFFKALLFLSSGVVMHAMVGELDMRKMSGLKRYLPKTRILMLIGCLALSGFPLLAGFFSKDEIIGNAWAHSKVLGGVMLFAALLTSYYTFRLYFRVFEGPEILPESVTSGAGHGGHGTHDDASGAHTAPGHDLAAEHAEEHHHDHEPSIMILPLVVLALGAIFAGYINFPADRLAEFVGQSPSLRLTAHVARTSFGDTTMMQPLGVDLTIKESNAETAQRYELMIVSGLISILGIAMAYVMHLADRPRAERVARAVQPLTDFLEHKYWFDELYQAAIVDPLWQLGHICAWIDNTIVDGLVWTVSFIPQFSGFVLKLTVQRGYLQGYAVTMLLGLAAILLIIFMHI
jgi:NADH-quinone oxidoreductase subunit L